MTYFGFNNDPFALPSPVAAGLNSWLHIWNLIPPSQFLSVHFRKRERGKRKRSAAVFPLLLLSSTWPLWWELTVDHSLQLQKGSWRAEERTAVLPFRYRKYLLKGRFSQREGTAHSRCACRLQKMGVGVDGWVRVQDMTGHPNYYLFPAFPDEVKAKMRKQ